MIWTVLRPLTPYIAGALIVTHGGVYLIGRHHGAEAEKAAEAKRLAKAQKAVVRREKKAEATTKKVADKITAQQVRIEYRTKTIIEKVPVYVTAEADAACSVPVGFVVLHDAAASGSEAKLPAAPGGSVEAPSGVALSTVSETVAVNYGIAYQWRAEALGWREWYERQASEWNARR